MEHFSSSAGLAKYKGFEDLVLTGDVSDEDQDILCQYLELHVLDLAAQLKMIRCTRPMTSMESTVAALHDMLREVCVEYDQVSQTVSLLMVSLASSAQA